MGRVPVTVVVGGSRDAREKAIAERVRACVGMRVRELSTDGWAFLRDFDRAVLDPGPVAILARHLEDAFPDAQAGGTRLVLTQSTYQLQRWLDWIDARGDALLLAEGDAHGLRRCAPEASARRGPWSRVEWIDLGDEQSPTADRELPLVESPTADGRRPRVDGRVPETDGQAPPLADTRTADGRRPTADSRWPRADCGLPDADRRPPTADGQRLTAESRLASYFRLADPEERLALCRREADATPGDPVLCLALGSVYMELTDLAASETAIERAIAAAPEWEAAHFELGKLMMRRDDLERASRAFAEAGRLMPSFAAAFSNLGATRGELGRPEEALAAFQQALRYDPHGYTVLNNIGVVSRELGRLPESEAAFRRVVSEAPEFVFGHYNLGHTLFLQGRFQAALSAYVEGQRRDPTKNVRQACRLAVVRLAAGDAEGSLRDIERFTANLPRNEGREILAEAQEILWALIAAQPGLTGWRKVSDAVTVRLNALT